MSSPYIPFYTSDFLGGTGGMTAAMKGVYITLLCLIYEEEGPVPQSWDMLARRCGCTLPAFKKAVEALQADGKIQIIDGAIWSDKCAKHIAQRGERRNSARSAAEKRWEKTQQKQGKADATAMRGQCQPEPEPEPYSDTNVSQRARGKPTYTDEFETWWQAYPNKTGKGAAFKAFQRAKRRGDGDRLFSALQQQLPNLEQAANRSDGNFCPHAATWLNQSRYDDEVSQPRGNLMSRIANGENPWTNASGNVLPLSQPRLPKG